MRRFALFLLIVAPAVASAQQWTPVGKTREGTEIFVKASSVKRAGDSVRVLILARYVPANFIAEGGDTIRAVTIAATFDCANEKVKTTETVRYANFDRGRVVARSKPKTPGFQAVFGGSMPQVYAHVCPKGK
jgi:hypothetical protein